MLNQDDLDTIVYRTARLGELNDPASTKFEVRGELKLTSVVRIDQRYTSVDFATAEIRRRLWDKLYGDLERPIAEFRRAVLSTMVRRAAPPDTEKVIAAFDQLEALLQMPPDEKARRG